MSAWLLCRALPGAGLVFSVLGGFRLMDSAFPCCLRGTDPVPGVSTHDVSTTATL